MGETSGRRRLRVRVGENGNSGTTRGKVGRWKREGFQRVFGSVIRMIAS